METKKPVTVTIDSKLLARIDAVCEKRNEARSGWFERLAANEIGAEEAFVASMENPIWRGLISTLAASPKVLEVLAAVAGEQIPEEELRQIRENVPELAKLGRERQQVKREKKVPQIKGA